MKITLLAVGKCKEKYWRDAVEEYCRRLSRYTEVDIQEVADEKTPDKASDAEERQIREREGERLLKKLREDDYVAALAIQGKQMDSVSLSAQIEQLGIRGVRRLVFVIGGSLGLSDAVMQRADWILSFSELTFPHQMMRVILLEQIYRSYKIMKREPYHK